MRQYEPIWNQLVKYGKAELVAHPSKHATIKQAVMKEKWRDKAYKLQMSESHIKMKLEVECNAATGIISFKLVKDTALNMKLL